MDFPRDNHGQLPDGIYFDLSNDDYHRDEALGSSNIKMLRQSAFEFWYESKFNPRRPKKKETDALAVGSAYHKIVLEGPQAFHDLYMRRPDDNDGATGPEKAAVTKAANAAAAKRGCESLHGDDFDRALAASDMIHKNPDLDGAFKNGVPEVSVFFTMFGIRQKVRIDYLKLRGFGDLKSIANERRRPIAVACRFAIKDYRIDMSMAHYLRGRAEMARLFAEERVFGDHDRGWLKKVVDNKVFAAQLVFIQKSGAPLVWSKTLSPANPIIKMATEHVDEGLVVYHDAMKKYGRDQMWIDAPPVSELTQEEMPPSFFLDQGAPAAA